jgi:hypothetical protein
MTKLIPLPDPLPPSEDPDEPMAAGFENLTFLKRLIWLYFWLLILEGALRKWVFPGLANPLLIVRDPVVILIYIVAASHDVFPKNGFIIVILGLAIVSGLASELAGHGNLLITLYGLRTNFLHLPLLFLLPNVFTQKDVHRLGKWLLLAALPMALLVVAQFHASPDSRLNVGVGGGIGGQMEVGFDKIRPPGTFSFTQGLVSFVALSAAFILSAQMRERSVNSKLAIFALPAVAVMVAVSGSRASLGVVVLIFAGVIFACTRKPMFFGKAIKGVLAVGMVYFALSFWSEFRTGLMIHESRITNGGGLEDGIVLRVLSDFASPFQAIADTPVFGEGLGMGTNVAGGLLYGERRFLLAEGEWERNVRESGPIIGFSFIALRIAMVIYLGRTALTALNHENPLPLLLFCAALPEVLNGQFGVPTTLGFAVLSGGLCLAEANSTEALVLRNTTPRIAKAVASTVTLVRGRSIYAEFLNGE